MTHLRITEAVPLGYALVARVAHDAGVRALCIKGPRSAELGLREPRTSIDVDVLVAPEDASSMVAALERAGWFEKPLTKGALIQSPHSRPMFRSDWGIEIDVHHRFPGFFDEPTRVFETLWERRAVWQVAGCDAWACDRTATALIDLLHYAREPRRQRRKLDFLLERDPAVVDEAVALGRDLGAGAALAPHVGVSPEPRPGDARYEAWLLQTRVGRQPAVAALHELRSTPWPRRPGVIWRLVWLPRDEVLARQPQLQGRPLGAARARVRRWLRGIRSLPAARRALDPRPRA